MKDEYDFFDAEQGKFYRQLEELDISPEPRGERQVFSGTTVEQVEQLVKAIRGYL